MKINAHLAFNGQCDAAFKFYEQVLGGKITMKMTYGESPMAKEFSGETQKQIMHARIQIGDAVIMGADAPGGRYQKPQGFQLTLSPEKPEEAERIFKALSEKGTVIMPMEETFWAHRFGMLVDQFGTPWMINCEKPMS
jgi:PhnB protein